MSHARNIQCNKFQFGNVIVSCSPDNDHDKVESDDDDDDFGGGVGDEVFPGDADVPETIEPMGMENLKK